MRYSYMTSEQRDDLFKQSWQQAQKHIGQTPEDNARWLLEVGSKQANFYDLPQDDAYALRWEMTALLHPTPDTEKGPTLGVTQDEACRWLKFIHDGVQELTKGRWWSLRSAKRYNVRLPLDHGSPEANWRVDDAMQQRIIEVLSAVQGRLRRCQNKTCGRLFVAYKRQEYCEKSCSNKVRVGKYRAKLRHARS